MSAVNIINARRRARKLALQALYQWHMSKTDAKEIEAQFNAINNMQKVDVDYFTRLLHGVIKELSNIDSAFTPLLDRPHQQLNPVELSILRLSTFELLYCLEVPYRIILDESVSLAKTFGSQDGHRYVNGVLHNLALNARKLEHDDAGKR